MQKREENIVNNNIVSVSLSFLLSQNTLLFSDSDSDSDFLPATHSPPHPFSYCRRKCCQTLSLVDLRHIVQHTFHTIKGYSTCKRHHPDLAYYSIVQFSKRTWEWKSRRKRNALKTPILVSHTSSSSSFSSFSSSPSSSHRPI